MGTEDQRNRGHRELAVQWKSRNRGSVNSEHKGLEEQWAPWTSNTMSTENQWNSGHRGPEEQWAQRTSEYRGPEEQWIERKSGHKGPED